MARQTARTRLAGMISRFHRAGLSRAGNGTAENSNALSGGLALLLRGLHGMVLLTGIWWMAALCTQFLLPAAPPPLLVTESPVVVASGIASRHVYGLAAATAPATSGTEKSTAAYRLVGLIAASGPHTSGTAVLAEHGKTETLVVQAGQDVAPGIRLLAVAADHVILRTGQGEFSLRLPEPARPVSSPTASQGKTCLSDC